MGFPFLRSNSVRVCVRHDLAALPPLTDISPLYIREMDMRDESEIRMWLEIHNEAFHRAWGLQEYEASMLRHPCFLIMHTYFMMDGHRPIGTGSVGVYRRNKEVGVCHYLQFRTCARERGLGQHMALYRLHRLKQLGVRTCEIVTTLKHKKALFIHFDLGAQPKLELDHWNDLKGKGFLRALAHMRLERMYGKWNRSRAVKKSYGASTF